GGRGEVVSRKKENQTLAECPPARESYRNWPQADRKGSTQVSHLPQSGEGRSPAKNCLRLRPGPARRLDGGHRLWKILRATGFGTTRDGGHTRPGWRGGARRR